jgi:hypothetical protein
MVCRMPELIRDMKRSVCQHEALRSATTHYDHGSAVLRFVLVCDECRAEVQEITRFRYRPQFRPDRDPPLAA